MGKKKKTRTFLRSDKDDLQDKQDKEEIRKKIIAQASRERTGDCSNVYIDVPKIELLSVTDEKALPYLDEHLNLCGDGSKIWGIAKPSLSGNVSNNSGCITFLEGDLSKLSGNLSDICGKIPPDLKGLVRISGPIDDVHGDISRVFGPIVKSEGETKGWFSCISGNLKRVWGEVSGIEGDVSNLEGDLTPWKGKIHKSLRGKIHKDSRGDVSGVEGDITGIGIDFTGINGDAKEIMNTIVTAFS